MKNELLNRQSVSLPGTKARFKSDFTEETASMLRKASPLAQEYASATIFFGDLVGFTAWSSTRSPEEVFELLETIYQTFDKIARKKSVFKVETVSTVAGVFSDDSGWTFD